MKYILAVFFVVTLTQLIGSEGNNDYCEFRTPSNMCNADILRVFYFADTDTCTIVSNMDGTSCGIDANEIHCEGESMEFEYDDVVEICGVWARLGDYR